MWVVGTVVRGVTVTPTVVTPVTYITKLSKVSLQELFMLDVNSKGTRGHSCKLVKTVDASSINVFKSRLIYIRDNRMGFFMD